MTEVGNFSIVFNCCSALLTTREAAW